MDDEIIHKSIAVSPVPLCQVVPASRIGIQSASRHGREARGQNSTRDSAPGRGTFSSRGTPLTLDMSRCLETIEDLDILMCQR